LYGHNLLWYHTTSAFGRTVLIKFMGPMGYSLESKVDRA